MTALPLTEPARAARRSRCLPAYQVALAALVVLVPVVTTLATARSTAWQHPVQLFEATVGGAFPLVFGVVVVCFGCLTLSWQLGHGFITATRTRQDVRQRLTRMAVVNAVTVFTLFLAAVLVMAVVAFTVAPRLSLVMFDIGTGQLEPWPFPDAPSALDQRALTSNTWSFLYAHGWEAYALAYGAFLGVGAAAWSTLGFLLVLVVPNRYLALSLPLVILVLVDFVLQVAGVAQFSPVLTLFPVSITAQPLWTVFVPVGLAALATGALGWWCWRHTDHLESLT